MSRLFCLEGDVTRIGEDFGGCLTVKNWWGFLTGDDVVGSAIIRRNWT